MYSKNEEEIFKILNSNIDGLDSKETEKRLKDYGQNIILNKKKKVWILRFLKQFNDTMIIILLVVALLLYFYGYFYSHEYTDTIVILFVVFINAIVGFIQEEKANVNFEDTYFKEQLNSYCNR
ncbi:MAG: cation-transporting P-type ATPase [Tenericutes bacterium]|nr:cation-transporting P-type ATPase [Mycoplasmatota bacterium]